MQERNRACRLQHENEPTRYYSTIRKQQHTDICFQHAQAERFNSLIHLARGLLLIPSVLSTFTTTVLRHVFAQQHVKNLATHTPTDLKQMQHPERYHSHKNMTTRAPKPTPMHPQCFQSCAAWWCSDICSNESPMPPFTRFKQNKAVGE